LLFRDVDAAADRDEQECMEGVGSKPASEIENPGQLMRVVSRDGCINLNGYA
jgi:hypothetical protein